jgi:hypothetical protein
MAHLLNFIWTHIKGHKAGYILIVILAAVLITETPLRGALYSMLDLGTHTQQLKNGAVIGELSSKLDTLSSKVSTTEAMLAEMQVLQWQAIITNDQLPTVLRMEAYDAYIGSGHNSWVHDYYEAELKPLNTNLMKYRLHSIKH